MKESIRASHDLRLFGKARQTRDRSRLGYMREVELLNSALCFYMGVAKGRGREAVLPGVGMNWLRGIRRVHGQMIPSVTMVHVPMKSVSECYMG